MADAAADQSTADSTAQQPAHSAAERPSNQARPPENRLVHFLTANQVVLGGFFINIAVTMAGFWNLSSKLHGRGGKRGR